jgi:hypothetical protein
VPMDGGSRRDMLVCPARVYGGGAAAEATEYCTQVVRGDTEGSYICGRYAGGFLMWVEGSELLHDVGGDGCER